MNRGLILTPGASASKDSPALVAIEKALRPSGIKVKRIDLPSSSAKAERHAEVIAAAATKLGVDSVFLGGRSFGGRMCSMAVAADFDAAGLVLLSYPLHPPGRPQATRTAHFPDLHVPCLFVSGTKDTFGSRDELEAAAAAIRGEVTHVWIEGGDHGMKGKDAAVARAVKDWLLSQA